MRGLRRHGFYLAYRGPEVREMQEGGERNEPDHHEAEAPE